MLALVWLLRCPEDAALDCLAVLGAGERVGHFGSRAVGVDATAVANGLRGVPLTAALSVIMGRLVHG